MLFGKKLLTLSLISVLAFSLTACKEELYTNLSESDANDIMITLLKRGVSAQKINEGKKGFTVEVEEEDFVRALEITKENSLPKANFASLGSVFSGQGMIASQTEEQARLAFALSQELSATFSKIDGVLDARVHVVLVQHEQASGVTTPPSAAVFLRHNEDSPVINMIAAIKETTAKSVPGLTVERVSVMTEKAQESILAPKLKVQHWYASPIVICALTIGALSFIVTTLLLVLKFMGFHLKRISKKEETQAENDSSSL